MKTSGENEILPAKRYTNNAEAYQYYLRGRHFWNKYSEAGLKKSIVYYRKAINIDADYALAYAGLADSHFRLANIHVSPKTALPKSKAMALKAVEIDSNLAEAHISLGIIKCYYDHDWRGAEAAYRRAIELNPGLSLARQRYAAFLMLLNRLDEALAEFKSCQELDPLSLQLGVGYATCLTIMGRYEEAIAQLDETIELDPNYYPAQMVAGWVYLHKGEHKKAAAKLKESLRVEENPFALSFLGYNYAVSGQKKEAEKILERLENDAARKYVSPYFLAVIHTGLKQKEKALDLLERLFDEHNDWLIWFKVAPELNSLRPEPRFVEMLKRAGML